MSMSGKQRTSWRRIAKKKTLRGIKPNESSATRDSMHGTGRDWGDGSNIDHRGNQDTEMWDKAGIQDDSITEEEYEDILVELDIIGGYDEHY